MNNIPTDDKVLLITQDFFGKETNSDSKWPVKLRDSFCTGVPGNVYTFGPTFRAENSNTTRHAAEFWMIEPGVLCRFK